MINYKNYLVDIIILIGGEYLYKIWVVDFMNEKFVLYSNKNKGLSISIIAKYGDDSKCKVIKMFLDKLYQLLK